MTKKMLLLKKEMRFLAAWYLQNESKIEMASTIFKTKNTANKGL
jgi:hypothetical protein